jgi:large conductance mechanosensitive channel
MTTATAATPPATEQPKLTLFQEFRAFLDKYGVVGLAIAFVIGSALTVLVKAVVNDLLMPLVTPLIPGGDWKTAEWNLGPVQHLAWGDLLSNLINFIIIAAFVFLVAKFVLRQKEVGKI